MDTLTPLFAASYVTLVVGFVQVWTGTLPDGCACLAATNVINGTGQVIEGDTPAIGLNVASLVIVLAVWWHSGGGDNTRRRLRRAARAFRPVRRTAPAAGAA